MPSSVRPPSRQEKGRAESICCSFQLTELDEAAPVEGEDVRLASTRQLLTHAETLQRLCRESYADLYEADHAALATLERVWRQVAELATLDERFVPFLGGRDEIKPQLEELAFFLRSYGSRLESSPDRLQTIEDRLAQLERLKKKYGPSLDDVLGRHAELRRELDEAQGSSERTSLLASQVEAARAGYLEVARRLSGARRAEAVRLARDLEKLLEDLAMAQTRFEIKFDEGVVSSEDLWTERGFDRAEFYLSPNPGEDLRPLAKVASGGELSRVMLALKTLASTDTPGKTLVFDEVDAGIGASTADKVGSTLADLGGRFQVLCVTHLPQIAAYAQNHFRISKSVRDGRTITSAERLAGESRVDELAKLMTGDHTSSTARASARELVQARNESE